MKIYIHCILYTFFSFGLLLWTEEGNAQKAPAHHHSQQELPSSVSDFSFKQTAGLDIKNYLETTLPHFSTGDSRLVLDHDIRNLGGRHFTFHQEIDGVKVFHSQIKANTDVNGNILSMFDLSFSPDLTASGSFPTQAQAEAWLAAQKLAAEMTSVPVWFSMDNKLVPGRLITLSGNALFSEVVINSQGETIFEIDRLAYHHFHAPDSLVPAQVFMPDPLTTANVTYGAPYVDSNDGEITELNNERVEVDILVDYNASTGIFSLENPYVKITDHNSPFLPPVTSTSPSFNFTRGESGFEQVNILYHITAFQEYVQTLGFNNLCNYQIHADGQAFSADQSNFNGATNPPRLNFGIGGVDDGEDADVIIHEYGHALSYSAAPETNFGTERGTLDEALGDYLAASYSRHLNAFGWERVFTWDGHNEFWDGRMATSSKHYPEDRDNNIYRDADIWSGTMMEIWGDIGRETTDKILLQSLFSYSAGMSMRDAAWLLMQADQQLNNGNNLPAICARLSARGLINEAWCLTSVPESQQNETIFNLTNTEGFANGSGSTRLTWLGDLNPTLTLTDVQGRTVANYRPNQGYLEINSSELSPGVYFLNAISEKGKQSFKLVKLQ